MNIVAFCRFIKFGYKSRQAAVRALNHSGGVFGPGVVQPESHIEPEMDVGKGIGIISFIVLLTQPHNGSLSFAGQFRFCYTQGM